MPLRKWLGLKAESSSESSSNSTTIHSRLASGRARDRRTHDQPNTPSAPTSNERLGSSSVLSIPSTSIAPSAATSSSTTSSVADRLDRITLSDNAHRRAKMEWTGGEKMGDGELDRLLRAAMKLDIGDRRELAMQLIWSLPRDDVVLINKGLSQTLRKDMIATLPVEVAHVILSKLKFEDIFNCTLVSRTWAARCRDQALWSKMCSEHNPPIVPAKTSLEQLEMHRQLMHAHIIPVDAPISTSARDSDSADDALASDPLFAQGGMGGGGGIDPVASDQAVTRRLGWASLHHNPFRSMAAYTRGLRHDVWERNGSSAGYGTPSASSGPRKVDQSDYAYGCFQPYRPQPDRPPFSPIPSDYEDDTSPEDGPALTEPRVNYKHLYIVHAKLERRMREPMVLVPSPYPAAAGRIEPVVKPRSLDAMASVTNGGLPGHLENIYALDMFRHDMQIEMDVDAAESGSLETLSGPRRPSETMTRARDWLLSGSRDKTMRLWVLDSRPRVVKVFGGGHAGSVLSIVTVEAKWASTDLGCSVAVVNGGKGTSVGTEDGRSDTEHDENGVADDSPAKAKVWAITGGSDGCICLWDVEGNKGDKPDKTVKAHFDSVLCVRANADRVVSCSKDHAIKVFSLPGLKETLKIQIPDQRGAVNAVGMSDKFIVAGSADKTLRVWCVETGQELVSLNPHTRGIASVAFDPTPPPYLAGRSRARGGIILGTIVTGSSDASVKIFNLVQYPSTPGKTVIEVADSDRGDVGDSDDEDESSSMNLEVGSAGYEAQDPDQKLYIEKRTTCYSACICPPGLGRPNGKRCGRCLNRGHMELVRSVWINRGVILSGSYDGSVKVWDRLEGRALADLSGNRTGRVFSVVGDRVRVATAGMDCRIMLWDFGQGLDTAFVEP